NNTYIVTVRATDNNGKTSTQTITVTISNVDEIAQKLGELGSSLRSDLRNHAFSSLSAMLAFNEHLLEADESCGGGTGGNETISGHIRANEQQTAAGARFAQHLSTCESSTRLLIDGGFNINRVDGNWISRGLASARIKQRIGHRTILSAALIGTTASDDLGAFEDSQIADKSLQINLYARTSLSDTLRFAAFAGWGHAWYSFDLTENGFALNGKINGKRHLYGAALSGDVTLAGVTVTTDAIFSRAIERLGSAKLDASVGGETRDNMRFNIGKVDITRLSIPVHIPVVFDHPNDGREATQLDFRQGILCQDTRQDSSAVECGFQFGAKLRISPSQNSVMRADALVESVNGYLLNQFMIGFERRLLNDKPLALGIDLGRTKSQHQIDDRIMIRFGIKN
ncbi:MAG: hypothetical protein ACO25F_07230, partial [Erythrobacter sp.]